MKDTQVHQKSYKKIRILTIFLTKDESTFVKDNYESVERQNVTQDIYVVSAKPIRNKTNNFVVNAPNNLSVPLRIGISIRALVKKINLKNYEYIFKVDGDIRLPSDYLDNLLEKNICVAGSGPALLISVSFFLEEMSGKYPLNYCDDGYILALGASTMGILPLSYNGTGLVEISPNPVTKKIEFYYGMEYYKFGLPLRIQMLNKIWYTLSNPSEGVKSIVYCFAGYFSAIIKREKRYKWWKQYSEVAMSPISWKIYLSSRRKEYSIKKI